MSLKQQDAQVELSQGDRNRYGMLGKQKAGTPDERKIFMGSQIGSGAGVRFWKHFNAHLKLSDFTQVIRFYNGSHRKVVIRRAQ